MSVQIYKPNQNCKGTAMTFKFANAYEKAQNDGSSKKFPPSFFIEARRQKTYGQNGSASTFFNKDEDASQCVNFKLSAMELGEIIHAITFAQPYLATHSFDGKTSSLMISPAPVEREVKGVWNSQTRQPYDAKFPVNNFILKISKDGGFWNLGLHPGEAIYLQEYFKSSLQKMGSYGDDWKPSQRNNNNGQNQNQSSPQAGQPAPFTQNAAPPPPAPPVGQYGAPPPPVSSAPPPVSSAPPPPSASEEDPDVPF
jgi:hypothetical protein